MSIRQTRTAAISETQSARSPTPACVQCTLTACNSLLQALAIAASLLSVSMIGVPSAAWSAKSFSPGAIFGAWGNRSGTPSGSNVTLTSLMVSTPLSFKRSSPLLVPLFVLIDSNCLNDPFGFRPGKVDRQQPVFQIRAQHLHPLRQHEGALEVARGDAAMDVLPSLVVLLAAPDDELVFLNGHIELVTGKTRHRQRDAQPFGLAAATIAPLDI